MGEKHQGGGTNSLLVSAVAAAGAMAITYLTIEVAFKPLLDRLRQSFPKSRTKGGEDVEITKGGEEEKEKEVKVAQLEREEHGEEKAKEKEEEKEVKVEKPDEECAGDAKGKEVEIEKVDKEERKEVVKGEEIGVEVGEGKPDKEDEGKSESHMVKEAEVEVQVLPSSPSLITSAADPQSTASSTDVHKDDEDDASAKNFTTAQVETEK